MGYTNKTTHYELPQYVATDKPKYLTDFNETMVAIDTQMYTNAQAAAAADTKADAAQSTADGAVSSIGTLNTQINGDPTDPSDTGLNGQVADNSGDIDTIQALLGNGTPTTSNQTVIGAINGLEGAIAPREDGSDLANSYLVGEQFARGGSVFEALVPLTAATAFASLTLNTDYKVADTLVEQIADNTNKISDLKIVEHYISISLDGSETVAQALPRLNTAITTYAATLPANTRWRVRMITCLGHYYKPRSLDFGTSPYTGYFIDELIDNVRLSVSEIQLSGAVAKSLVIGENDGDITFTITDHTSETPTATWFAVVEAYTPGLLQS